MAFQHRQKDETRGGVILDLTRRLPIRRLTVWQRVKIGAKTFRPGPTSLIATLCLGVLLGALLWEVRANMPFQEPFARLIAASRQDGGRFFRWDSPKGRVLLRVRGLYEGVDSREDAPRPSIPLLSTYEQKLCALWVISRGVQSVPLERLVAVSVVQLGAGDPESRAQARAGLEHAATLLAPGSARHTAIQGDLAVAMLLGGDLVGGLARFREVLERSPRDPVVLYNGTQLVGRGFLVGDELAVLARFLQEEPDILWRRDAEERYRALMR